MNYPFPDDVRNPQRKGPNPFADGKEDSQPGQSDANSSTNDGIFRAGAPSEYNPVYETTYSDRVIITLVSAIVGLAMSLLAWLVFFDYPNNGLLGIFSVVFSVAAMILARIDMVGMKAGAIRRERASLAATGMVLGLLGLMNSLAILAYGIFYEGWMGIM